MFCALIRIAQLDCGNAELHARGNCALETRLLPPGEYWNSLCLLRCYPCKVTVLLFPSPSPYHSSDSAFLFYALDSMQSHVFASLVLPLFWYFPPSVYWGNWTVISKNKALFEEVLIQRWYSPLRLGNGQIALEQIPNAVLTTYLRNVPISYTTVLAYVSSNVSAFWLSVV